MTTNDYNVNSSGYVNIKIIFILPYRPTELNDSINYTACNNSLPDFYCGNAWDDYKGFHVNN